MRTSVDLPEPERPITTNTSPGQTSNDTLRTAATQPVFARSSARGRSASGVPRTLSAWRPKIFHTPSARISGGPLRSIRWPLESDVPTVAVTASAYSRDQKRPTVRPSSSMSTLNAAGLALRPGIVCMSPQSATSQPAPV